MSNPSIEELQNKNQFEIIAELNHSQIKAFVLNQISAGSWLVKSYMIYQTLMFALGVILITRSVILAFHQNWFPLYSILAALVFCFSLLIVIHELLHGFAIKLTGAKKVNYGAYFTKFIFYAEADCHVLNKKQFAFIALTPLVVIKTISLIAVLLFFHQTIVYFWAFVMCAHSLFCAGDIALLSVFTRHKNSDVYTYDSKDEKKSYYFRKVV